MMTEITISCGQLSVQAWLNQSPTAEAIIAALPLTGQANTWGEEIYFEIPVDMPQEPDARTEVEVGDLGYWPAGNALCIFFGPTPVSNGEKPKAYSPVNPIGYVTGDARLFRAVRDGDEIRISSSPQGT
jgi:hypothetical protein